MIMLLMWGVYPPHPLYWFKQWALNYIYSINQSTWYKLRTISKSLFLINGNKNT